MSPWAHHSSTALTSLASRWSERHGKMSKDDAQRVARKACCRVQSSLSFSYQEALDDCRDIFSSKWLSQASWLALPCGGNGGSQEIEFSRSKWLAVRKFIVRASGHIPMHIHVVLLLRPHLVKGRCGSWLCKIGGAGRRSLLRRGVEPSQHWSTREWN
jgi:hypothetical protein